MSNIQSIDAEKLWLAPRGVEPIHLRPQLCRLPVGGGLQQLLGRFWRAASDRPILRIRQADQPAGRPFRRHPQGANLDFIERVVLGVAVASSAA